MVGCSVGGWMYLGQEKRRHMRAKICPILGEGSLSKSARERRASEIITESGADTVEYFKQGRETADTVLRSDNKPQVVARTTCGTRKRKPVAASALWTTWERVH